MSSSLPAYRATNYSAVPSASPCASILDNDSELRDCPEVFVRETLKQLAPRLLAGCKWALSSLAPEDKSRPAAQACRSIPPATYTGIVRSGKDPSLSPPPDSAIPPTHILSLPLSSTSSPPTQLGIAHDGRLLIPVHALPFSLSSPYFAAHLSQHTPVPIDVPSPPSSSSPLDIYTAFPSTPPVSPQLADQAPLSFLDKPLIRLPIVPLELPASPSFALLYDWVYRADPFALTRALLDGSSSFPAHSPSPAAPHRLPFLTPTLSVEDIVANMTDKELEACLDRVQSLRELVVLLQVEDRGLWESMERVWNAVADELEGVEGDEEDEPESEKEEEGGGGGEQEVENW